MSAERPSPLAESEGEAAALRRCMRDLVALSTLPAAWMHADALGLVESLVEVVLRMLQLDLGYARVPHGGARLEAGRTRSRASSSGRGAELGRVLDASLRFAASEAPRTIQAVDGEGRLNVVMLPIGGDRDCGWLVAASSRRSFPTEHERLLLGVAVNQLALMMQRRAAEDRLREEAHTLEMLNRVGESLTSERNLEPLLQRVTDLATGLCGAQFGAFFYNVEGEAGESYQLYTLSGATRESFARFPMPRNTEIFAPTFAGIGIVRSDDIRKDARYGRNAPYRGLPEGHLPVASYLAVPVVSRSSEVLGGLFFGHAKPGIFNERAERVVAGIAAQAGVAIENARLYERLRDGAARLAESDRRKDEFLATLAHELRNPLAPMRNALKLLELAPGRPELGAQAEAMMRRQLDHMMHLVDDLLDLGRISVGKIELRRERVELGAVVHSALEAVQPLIERSGQSLEVSLPGGSTALDADPVRLAQVFSNLLNNAAKYTPRGGQLWFVATSRDAEVEVRVRDTGMGIPPKMLGRVFDMFTQVDASLEKAHGGLGIGLTIVKRLVELHGGSVAALSDGPGSGSEFVVRLPLATPSAQPAGVAPLATPAARVTAPRPLRVLVVDDNIDAATSLALVLQARGHDAITAHDGVAALAAVASNPPDVVVLDIGMPGMNGYDACRRIRAEPSGRGVTMVALSGWGQDEHKARARDAGFDHYFIKPVDPDALRALLEDSPPR